MKRFLFVALLSAFVLTACNTMQGFGKDLEKVAESIGSAAKK